MITWINKRGNRQTSLSKKDVKVTINKNGKSRKTGEVLHAVAIRFMNESFKKVTANGYVSIGFDLDLGRVYFSTAEGKTGFKLTQNSKGDKVRYLQLSAKNGIDWHGHTGEYDLTYDADNKLYYIDISKNETEDDLPFN